MKADNLTTDHNRTIKLTELPTCAFGVGRDLPAELTITVMYQRCPGDRTLDSAVSLDSVVIPEIIRAINNHGVVTQIADDMLRCLIETHYGCADPECFVCATIAHAKNVLAELNATR